MFAAAASAVAKAPAQAARGFTSSASRMSGRKFFVGGNWKCNGSVSKVRRAASFAPSGWGLAIGIRGVYDPCVRSCFYGNAALLLGAPETCRLAHPETCVVCSVPSSMDNLGNAALTRCLPRRSSTGS